MSKFIILVRAVLFKIHLVFLVIVFAPAGWVLPDVAPATKVLLQVNKLASLEATLVRNYDRPSDTATDGGKV